MVSNLEPIDISIFKTFDTRGLPGRASLLNFPIFFQAVRTCNLASGTYLISNHLQKRFDNLVDRGLLLQNEIGSQITYTLTDKAQQILSDDEKIYTGVQGKATNLLEAVELLTKHKKLEEALKILKKPNLKYKPIRRKN